MGDDDEKPPPKTFDEFFAWLIANRHNLPMAPDPEPSEELLPREIKVPVRATNASAGSKALNTRGTPP